MCSCSSTQRRLVTAFKMSVKYCVPSIYVEKLSLGMAVSAGTCSISVIYIYIYIYIYTYTHIYIYKYIYVYKSVWVYKIVIHILRTLLVNILLILMNLRVPQRGK